MKPKDFLHEHPLHYFEEWSNNVHGKTRGVNCSSGCGQPISTQFYACIDCKFFLHKSCSELPLNITHPFHDNHPLTLLAKAPASASCDFCGNLVDGFVYHCSCCRFKLHIIYALLPQFLTGNFPKRDHHFSDVDEHPLFFIQEDLISSNKVELHSRCFVCPESLFGVQCSPCKFQLHPRCALLITKDLPKRDHHFSHVEHPLVFVQMLSNEVKINSSCSVCSKPLLGTSFYNCPDCGFFLHKECEAELWPEIEHVAHPAHPLIPVFSANYTCNFCQGKSNVKKSGYKCLPCGFYIHHECTLPRFFPESKIHEHELSPFMRKNPFICDACGGAGDDARYFCSKCSITIHKDCIFLPKLIKFKLHNHHILGHNYRFPQKVGEKWTCQVCFKKVVAEYGSYKCLHLDCNYVLHGSCIKKYKGRLYIEVESEKEESDEASSSSSCAVGLGDMIKHFSHKHELVLDNREIIISGDKECCDGCALPILTAAYSCPQPECNFSLHKACGQLGEEKPHWAYQDPLRVSMGCIFRCEFCKYDCSGFYCSVNRYSVCHRCIEIPFNPTHQAHDQHSLFCDKEYKGPCSGCGRKMGYHGGYKCTLAEEEENCKFFALDYRCLTRPLTAEHRFHHHPLKLTYEDPYKDDDGDPFQHV
ncbi:hypothetical protein SLEP1_g51612 [Rubroshorea leprosula]|uniref:Phorbol-ester/DAG-type domain-containing protein n=1 Tax=Rubroshorea leprosula TaxID=152421 RepID=A0AAV5M7E1_9ROSI|nr:hypothetical protein SLEP1_g51612 [Rubroshorea leprosula]